MIATFRLSEHLASFDFFYWLVMVQAAGATKIEFDISNPKIGKVADPLARFYSIIEPGPALAGLPHRMSEGRANTLNATPIEIIQWCRRGNTFKRLRTVKPVVSCSYTVTLRDQVKAPGRNGNADVWRKFAEEIGAVVIEEYRHKQIHLHDRFALYAGSKMNFGVCNGPITAASLTEYPVRQFVNTESARNNMMRWRIMPGQDYPWMLPHQKLVWVDDTLDNLRREFEAIC